MASGKSFKPSPSTGFLSVECGWPSPTQRLLGGKRREAPAGAGQGCTERGSSFLPFSFLFHMELSSEHRVALFLLFVSFSSYSELTIIKDWKEETKVRANIGKAIPFLNSDSLKRHCCNFLFHCQIDLSLSSLW